MLLKFKVANYRSFKDEVECSLEASAIKEYADTNVFEHENLRVKLLKSVAVYGANAAGKSNLLRAFEFMRTFVLDSAKNSQANERIDVDNFKLHTRTAKRPSVFEIEFIHDNKTYQYGFQVDKERIWREHLYEIRRTKNVPLFQRLYNVITVSENFGEGKGLEEKTRINALFLSVIAQFNGAISSRIVGWFQRVIFLSEMNSGTSLSHSMNVLSDEKRRPQLLKILKVANLGFENIVVRKFKLREEHLAEMPDDLRKLVLSSTSGMPGKVLTYHKTFDQNNEASGQEEFSFSEEESTGTQKYFSLAGHILDALTGGSILVVDELDAGLHPLLSTLIVQFFNSIKDNVANSQLIFSTNNTNFLSDKILRRDQVFFVEKDQYGSSKLESLLQKGVRNDASFEKEYLNGEYNAVPFSNRDRPQLNLFSDDDKLSLF